MKHRFVGQVAQMRIMFRLIISKLELIFAKQFFIIIVLQNQLKNSLKTIAN